jgi:hypothetical protein
MGLMDYATILMEHLEHLEVTDLLKFLLVDPEVLVRGLILMEIMVLQEGELQEEVAGVLLTGILLLVQVAFQEMVVVVETV